MTLIDLITRVLMLQLIPLSPTFELPLSHLSQSIGMIPTAVLVIAISYLVIVVVMMTVQNGVAGGKMARAAARTSAFSALWFVGVLETVSALGKPLAPELLIGRADIVPIVLLGILTSAWTSSDAINQQPHSLFQSISSLIVVTLLYFAGRYFLYAVVHVNSGYFAREEATFAWTLAMEFAIGPTYVLFGWIEGKKSFAKRTLVCGGCFWHPLDVVQLLHANCF